MASNLCKKEKIAIKPYSIGPIEVPTEFAELDVDLLVKKKKSYIDCSGCENRDASDFVLKKLSNAILESPELLWDHWKSQDKNLRHKLASMHRVAPEQIFITSGALAGIEHCFKIFSHANTKTGILKPDWPGFEHFADYYKNEKFSLENFTFPFIIDAPAISEFVQRNKLELVVFANPLPINGSLIQKEAIKTLLADNRRTLFLIDEADSVTPELNASELTTQYNNVIFLNSLSKFYGLSGLRIGYLVTPSEYIVHFDNTISPAEVTSLSILAANFILEDTAYHKRTKQNVALSKRLLEEVCENSSYQVAATPHCFAAYIYSEITNPKNDLNEEGLRILEGQFFGLPPAVYGGRFNLSDPDKAKLAVSAIKKALQHKSEILV